MGPICAVFARLSGPVFSALETSDEEVPFMTFARLDAPDALELTEFHSEAVCRNSLSRAPSRLDLRAQGPIFADLKTQQSIYRFQLFQAFRTRWCSPFLHQRSSAQKVPCGS